MIGDTASPLLVPKHRPPWVYYAWVLSSGGLFIFFWNCTLMCDINLICKRDIFPARLIALAALFLFTIGISLILLSIAYQRPISFDLMLVVLVAFASVELIVIVAVPIAVYSVIANAEGCRIGISGALFIVSRMFLLGMGLPFLQKHLNQLIAVRY